jgi:hypothetical protein
LAKGFRANDVHNLGADFGLGNDGTPRYRLLARDRKQVDQIIEIAASEGSMVLVFDDSRKLSQVGAGGWNMGGRIDHLMTIAAALNLTVILCANSTVWSSSGLRDQCAVYFLGRMSNDEQRARFVGIAGLRQREYLPVLNSLPEHAFLYADRYGPTGEVRLAITSF